MEVLSGVRSEIRRVVVAVMAGVLLCSAMLAIIVVVNQGLDLSGCVAATPLGWTAILVSGLVIAVAGWMLFSAGRRFDDGPRLATVECPVCGRAVLEEWRLCPYCGSEADVP
jgi:hypothetical protein